MRRLKKKYWKYSICCEFNIMREIVLDTETTGLDPEDGHRIVEIGAVELMNHVPTGKEYHQYINPLMAMPDQAFAVHGLSDEFLSDKPKFSEIVNDGLLAVLAYQATAPPGTELIPPNSMINL